MLGAWAAPAGSRPAARLASEPVEAGACPELPCPAREPEAGQPWPPVSWKAVTLCRLDLTHKGWLSASLHGAAACHTVQQRSHQQCAGQIMTSLALCKRVNSWNHTHRRLCRQATHPASTAQVNRRVLHASLFCSIASE